MILIEILVSMILYYFGFSYYCSGNWGATAIFAFACSLCVFDWIRRAWKGRYVNMRLRKIDRLSGKEFEDYLYVQFRRLGYRVKNTEESHDYGADLILKRRGERIVVQAKRYDRNIGISAVQEAVGAVAYYEADRAMVVTNQYFTKSARNLANQNEVELWDRSELKKKFRVKE